MTDQQILFETQHSRPRFAFTPREYQHEAFDNAMRMFDDGTEGVLLRIFTGGGKTLTTCMLADEWINRGPNYRAMIISYENQLVWQFGQEIEDVLGIRPGIEMAGEEIDPTEIPQIVVASRQTLMRHKLISDQQVDDLAGFGIARDDLKLCTSAKAKRFLRMLRDGVDAELVRDELDEWNRDYRVNHETGVVSRVHKFDHRDNWLVCWDEAHKHAHHLTTVGHIVDWFRQNRQSRRLGMTATPKRSDGISIGEKMFPGVAIDYPLVAIEGPNAVADGYAVPYRQRYIKVEGVDFAELRKISGTSQSEWDRQLAMRLESQLAGLCIPMLDMAENHRTLIFSPSVHIAKEAAAFINAREKCLCDCEKHSWHPLSRIGDGAKCPHCDRFIIKDYILETPAEQARALWGEIPAANRKEVYAAHQAGEFQFLSVCGLAREGYNDPDISCIAVFRQVSKEASSLAEQMKGRGSRPKRGVIDGLETAEERLSAIEASDKPFCLIIDLTGVTGLEDCATTVQIYAAGEPDEVQERAQEIVEDGEENVAKAIDQAKKDIAEEKEKARLERERRDREARENARRRAEAGASVDYSVHEVGHSHEPWMATDKQLKYIRFLGMELHGFEPSKRQAGRIIDQLQSGADPADVAYTNGVKEDQWQAAEATNKQKWFLRQHGVDPKGMSSSRASAEIELIKNFIPNINAHQVCEKIRAAKTDAELTEIGKAAMKRREYFDAAEWATIVESGKLQRQVLKQGEF